MGRRDNAYSGWQNPELAAGFSNLSRAMFGSAADDAKAAETRLNRAKAAQEEFYANNLPGAQSALAAYLSGQTPMLPPEYQNQYSAEDQALIDMGEPEANFNANQVMLQPERIDPAYLSNLAGLFLNPSLNQNTMWQGVARQQLIDQARNSDNVMRGLQAALGIQPGPDAAYTDEAAARIRAENQAGMDRRAAIRSGSAKPVVVGPDQTAYLPESMQGQYGGQTQLQGSQKPVTVGEGQRVFLPGEDGYTEDRVLEGRQKATGSKKDGGFQIKPGDWNKISKEMENVLFDLESQLNAGEDDGYEYRVPAPLRKLIQDKAERLFREGKGNISPSNAMLQAIGVFYGNDLITPGEWNMIGPNDMRIVVPGGVLAFAKEKIKADPSPETREKVINDAVELGIDRESFIKALDAGN